MGSIGPLRSTEELSSPSIDTLSGHDLPYTAQYRLPRELGRKYLNGLELEVCKTCLNNLTVDHRDRMTVLAV